MAQANEDFDMDDLLDMSIGDLADLPEFKSYPAGAHRVVFDWEKKKVNDQRAIEFKLTALETLELSDPVADVPLEAGTETTVLFQLDNEIAQGKFKPLVTILANHHGVSTTGEALLASKGMEITVVTSVRKDKKDVTKTYTTIENIII